MSADGVDPSLEEPIAQWRGYLQRHRSIDGPDLEELEAHLREEVVALGRAGLSPDEALLVAVKRMGSVDVISREFAQEHAERLWKQLVFAPTQPPGGTPSSDWIVALGLAVAAAFAVKLPALLGVGMADNALFYARNASLLVFPVLAIYLLRKRGAELLAGLRLALPFVVAAAVVNLYPYASTANADSDTENLTILHLPIALWLVIGYAYFRGRWFSVGRRMDFVRFSGELVIYFVLIALGGGVFTGFTAMIFRAIDLNPERLVAEWILPCGAAGAVIIGSWLVEAKQSVIENMAPVLTRVFTPLFAALLLVFLGTMAWTGNPIDVQREMLIGFDLLLVLVVGLVLYAASARDPRAPPDLFDRLQLLLVGSALAVDGLALASIGARISEFGLTPNRVAALGENLILLVNLAGTAWFYARFLWRQGSFAALEQWQIRFLPIYSLWAALVVVGLPLFFGFN